MRVVAIWCNTFHQDFPGLGDPISTFLKASSSAGWVELRTEGGTVLDVIFGSFSHAAKRVLGELASFGCNDSIFWKGGWKTILKYLNYPWLKISRTKKICERWMLTPHPCALAAVFHLVWRPPSQCCLQRISGRSHLGLDGMAGFGGLKYYTCQCLHAGQRQLLKLLDPPADGFGRLRLRIMVGAHN